MYLMLQDITCVPWMVPLTVVCTMNCGTTADTVIEQV